ncbi:NAD(P)/FAD-dependent oxidoreductase, partial [Rhodopirellula sallentina]|uniref:NAD(P)/FAD-dependent oxidoreductase n=1 Tax=Rhodopirellula sallentina TaxID=1263869 RepID=UPI001181A728
MIAKTPRPSRVLVVGAGVSGCAAAIRLAHHGHEVTLAERAEFPREKICGCCLGAAGMHALDAIGVGAPIRDLGESTH